jgi:magnesium chelatase family protein
VPLIRSRPFRAPHHTISHAGLVGGGNWPHPGEISLAHRGVLFLDELPEFARACWKCCASRWKTRLVTISRAQGSLTFPANFQLIGAMNPCPCGYYGDPSSPAPAPPARSPSTRSASPARCWTASTSTSKCRGWSTTSCPTGAPASRPEAVRERVEAARERQRARFAKGSVTSNADMRPAEVRKFCELDRLHQPDEDRHEPAAALGAGLPPRAQAGPHHRRPGSIPLIV